ncbi:uncharacterized protein LOC116613120 [Nematostella vectensis]|uniref:uncharacterized protein LOC116613120 n=1 Tax=Nematostella vectensis TaxID=45351 RepID=UPI0020773C18|nr:uncharacterized protein LOC116613120 [Nematostella vectensis]
MSATQKSAKVKKPLGDASGGNMASVTKTLVQLMLESPGKTIRLNQAFAHISAPKRRVCDAIEILAGIGLVETEGDEIYWLEMDDPPPGLRSTSHSTEELRMELKLLDSEEKHLDELIEHAREELTSVKTDPENRKYLFITKTDMQGMKACASSDGADEDGQDVDQTEEENESVNILPNNLYHGVEN